MHTLLGNDWWWSTSRHTTSRLRSRDRHRRRPSRRRTLPRVTTGNCSPLHPEQLAVAGSRAATHGSPFPSSSVTVRRSARDGGAAERHGHLPVHRRRGLDRAAQAARRRLRPLLQEHRRVLRDAAAAHGGNEMGTEGDAMFFWFPRAGQAARAAADGQRALARALWPGDRPIRVRWASTPASPRWSSRSTSAWASTGRRGSPRRRTRAGAADGDDRGRAGRRAGLRVGLRRLGEFRLRTWASRSRSTSSSSTGSRGVSVPRAEPGAAPSRRPSRRLVLGAIALAMLAVGGVVVALALIGGGGKSAASTTTAR